MATKISLDDKMKNAAVSRYGWLVLFMSFVFLAIVVKIFIIKYSQGSMWRELGQKERVKKDYEITPNRGNIYADDGRLLAASEPIYGVYIDFMAEGINADTLMKYLDPLSKSLAKKMPDRERTAAQYRKIILDGWYLSRKELDQLQKYKEGKLSEKITPKSRYVRIVRPDINYLELKELRTFPFLNQRSNRSGMITEEKARRLKPFGNLAGRTVGSLNQDLKKGGNSGLELRFDSIVKGIPGLKTRQRVQGRWIDVVEVDPQDGLDLQTSLNVDIQDLVERELRNKLTELSAESGCAIIMEVATGEIKAISNLDRNAAGGYSEGNPNVFSYMSEPGSTFKTISLMVALEDGVVTPDEMIHVGNGLFEYKGRTVRDHDWRKGIDKEYLTIREGMYTSSNVVISKMILKGYENNPQKYVQHIHDLGITKKMQWDVPLKGREGIAAIRFPDDKSNPWSKTTLPWMSFGYETQVPPIYTLMFYNGIANGGKMIKPFITKAFLNDGDVEQEFKAEVINPMLCSEKTLRQVKDILRGVVTDGTGKSVNTPIVEIAGKTGTAMIASHGGYEGYFVSFCGYFPANNPKYTCFVGIRRPQGIPSGGLMPGAVFKAIAEGVTIKDMIGNPIPAPKDTVRLLRPYVKNGLYKSTELVLDKLKQSYSASLGGAEWVLVSTTEKDISVTGKANIKEGVVPNTVWMGARDAVYLLEKAGLRVIVEGTGKVKEQSIAPGTPVQKGAKITIQLN